MFNPELLDVVIGCEKIGDAVALLGFQTFNVTMPSGHDLLEITYPRATEKAGQPVSKPVDMDRAKRIAAYAASVQRDEPIEFVERPMTVDQQADFDFWGSASPSEQAGF